MLRRIFEIITLLLILATTPLAASAQDSKTDAQRRRTEQYKKELEKAKREVQTLQKEKKSASKEVAALEREMRLRNGYISEVEDELRRVQADIRRSDKLIDSLEGELGRNREVYAEAVRVAYRNYSSNNTTNYILASNSIADAARRKAELEHITTSRKRLSDTIMAQTAVLDAERLKLAARATELDSLTRVLEAERRVLESSRVAAQRAYNRLSKREKEAINEQRKQQKQYDKAVAELQKMLKGNKVGAGFSRNTKGLNLPVDGGELTEQGFGGTVTGAKGAAVKSVYEGIVQDIQYKKTTNRYTVFMGYNEYLVTYTNLGSVSVKKGDIVKKDHKIGTIGNGIESGDKPYVRIAIYDCESKKPLPVSSFFKKK
ncbi:MAG: peptidoglycan DD-metalloendopeptidase family protein [Alistipes sp.]|nr:peptidoglycan DD-metalloendopeptidase family protein [Alistipes sp.]